MGLLPIWHGLKAARMIALTAIVSLMRLKACAQALSDRDAELLIIDSSIFELGCIVCLHLKEPRPLVFDTIHKEGKLDSL